MAENTVWGARLRCVGDRVQAGTYALHSAFDHAINLIHETTGEIITVVTSEIGAGPSNIVIEAAALPGTVSRLLVDEFPVTPRFNSSLEDFSYDPEHFDHALTRFQDLMLKLAPEKSICFLLDHQRERAFASPVEREILHRFQAAMDFLLSDQIDRAIALIRGVGWGLTPSGDDFIAGLFMARAFLAKLPANCVDSDWLEGLWNTRPNITEPSLTSTLLKQALDGAFCERWKTLISALIENAQDSNAIEQATRRVLEIGSTSGADTATGFLIGIRRGLNGG
jgi:hypothetical protein